MEQATIAQTLGRYLVGMKYDDLPPDVVELAKTRVLNGIGVSYPGKDLPAAVVAWKTVKDNVGPCTLIGHPEKVPAEDAALANGVAGHTILQEDVGAGGHPSVVVIPAALAVGEEVSASGRDVLAAIVAAYEAQGRISRGVTNHIRASGLRTVSLFGVFAAATAAGRLFGLSDEEMANALGFAGILAAGYYQGFAEGAMDPFFEVALSSQNGVRAARIAKNGGVASPLAFEGASGFMKAFTGSTENAQGIVKGLGEGFEIRSIASKPYATSRGNHDPIDLAVSISEQVKDPSQIRYGILRVATTTRATSGKDNLPPFRNITMAQMSLRFCVAAALLKRPVKSFEFFRDHYDDPEVSDLAYRVQVMGDEARKVPSLEVCLEDGKRIKLEEDRSHKFDPDTKQLEEFFQTLVGNASGDQRAAELRDAIMGLDEAKDIHELTDKLTG